MPRRGCGCCTSGSSSSSSGEVPPCAGDNRIGVNLTFRNLIDGDDYTPAPFDLCPACGDCARPYSVLNGTHYWPISETNTDLEVYLLSDVYGPWYTGGACSSSCSNINPNNYPYYRFRSFFRCGEVSGRLEFEPAATIDLVFCDADGNSHPTFPPPAQVMYARFGFVTTEDTWFSGSFHGFDCYPDGGCNCLVRSSITGTPAFQCKYNWVEK